MKKFEIENEYRFLWLLLNDKKEIIDVPDAPVYVPINN